ncbi:hypothetical protein MIND_01160300 [Mycena indigotica]|uniref:Uncharacterized protein n=1 Tax=Mycena indigotica TaxID=2126181 RepID=A0A8H6S496_9AGAR|nr:uncharacterized protein MIND_01160300 [Mycena indigotica]KAF7292624.1 hypothetical protein MIND_01160300 [Mycena indigotica]
MDPSPHTQPASDSDDEITGTPAETLQRRPAQRESVAGSLQNRNASGIWCGAVIGRGERTEDVLPNPLPIASPSPSSSPTRTNGCGTRVHASAYWAGGRWVAPPEGVSAAVIPLESTYFDPDAARMLELGGAAGCGCAARGVGCAVCGNALGALFTPCRTHTARGTGALRRQQHYIFLPGHVSPAIQDALTRPVPTTTHATADATPRPPAVTLPPSTTLPIRNAGPSVESGGPFPTIAPATLERFRAADAEVRQRLQAETARGDVDATPPVPDTFMAMESPFRELYQRLRERAGDTDAGNTNSSNEENGGQGRGATESTTNPNQAGSNNRELEADSDDAIMRLLDAEPIRRALGPETHAVGPFGDAELLAGPGPGAWEAGAGWPEPPPPPGILPPLEMLAPRPPVMGAGPGNPAAAIRDSPTADQPLPQAIEPPPTGATVAAPTDGVEEMIEVLRMVAEMGTPVAPPAPAPAADRDRRAALRRLADEQDRMDRGTPGPVTGAMDREWDALRVRAARDRVAAARLEAAETDGEIAPWYNPTPDSEAGPRSASTMPPERSEAPMGPVPAGSPSPPPRLLVGAHARRALMARRQADAGGSGEGSAVPARDPVAPTVTTTTTVPVRPIASGPPTPAAGDAVDRPNEMPGPRLLTAAHARRSRMAAVPVRAGQTAAAVPATVPVQPVAPGPPTPGDAVDRPSHGAGGDGCG